jgi:hypothetical protein
MDYDLVADWNDLETNPNQIKQGTIFRQGRRAT